VLAGVVRHAAAGDGDPSTLDRDLDPAARRAADRLRRDLVRVHPSFRFEERLATRLAEAAIAMRVPAAAGAEGRIVPFRAGPYPFDPAAPGDDESENGPRDLSRPLLIGGALTSAALSLAGAALVAWRRGRPRNASAMGRAVRAAHAAGGTAARRSSLRGSRRSSPTPWARGH
jgi:hypothetical protein